MKITSHSILLSILFVSQVAFTAAAAPVKKTTAAAQDTDFDSLGGNKIMFDKARALEPEQNISIVQNRAVVLKNRFEIAPEFSSVFGGETYARTRSIGLNVHYHLNYNWSFGAKYNHSFNTMTREGQAMIDRAMADYEVNAENPSEPYPQVDYAKNEIMGLVNWYPIYGKMNLYDKTVVHFDFYTLLGYGQIQLASGASPTYTAGGGFGFWLTNNFSTRLEMRYQNYTSKYLSKKQNMDLTIASVQMGWLL